MFRRTPTEDERLQRLRSVADSIEATNRRLEATNQSLRESADRLEQSNQELEAAVCRMETRLKRKREGA